MSYLPGHLRAQFAQARENHDWYVEGPECVRSLFNAVQFTGPIHDPCCGGGNIPKVAQDYGYVATGSDLVDRGYGRGGIDFLIDHTPRINIVSNPPYKLGEEFLWHALTVTERKVAVVMRLSFLEGQKRRENLFSKIPPSLVLVLSKRPSMPPGGSDIPAKGGTAAYCWLVYDQEHKGPTELRWTA